MTLYVNGEQQWLDGSMTVADLVARLGRGPRGIAVAVNDEVVPRSMWAGHELRDGDRVEVLQGVQGG